MIDTTEEVEMVNGVEDFANDAESSQNSETQTPVKQTPLSKVLK